jgi:hypothetical protein
MSDTPVMIDLAAAATLADVTEDQMRLWAARGVVICQGEGDELMIDEASVRRTIERRAEVDRARAAFTSDDPIDRIAYLSGEDPDDLRRVGG